MVRKSLLYMVAFIVVGFLVQTKSYAADAIKIGLMAPTTGGSATDGQAMINAMKLAIDEINAKGGVLGVRVESVIGDDGCDPQKGAAAASKLVSENVTAVVGGYCSGSTIPTLKLYGDAGIPMIIPAANSTKLIEANMGNAFQINSTGYDQTKTAVDLFQKKGITKLAIVHQGDAYSEDLARLTKEKFEKAGKQVVAYEVVDQKQQDFGAIVTKIKSKNAEGVFWTAYFAEGALLIKQLKQAGYKGIIAVGDGSNNVKLMEIAGRAAEGVYCFSNPTADFLPKAKKFIKDYMGKFKSNPGAYSPLAYDGMHLMLDAIKRAGSVDKTKIIEAIGKTDNFSGIAGPISFKDDKTLARSNFIVIIVKGGKFTKSKVLQ